MRGLGRYLAWPFGIDAAWLVAPCSVLGTSALLSPIRPFDYFWALVQGRAMLELGRIPTENLFLYTLPDRARFYDQPWLAQLALYAAQSLGGHATNLCLLALLLVLTLALCLDTALLAGARPLHAGVAALAVVPLLGLGSGVRTQMFAYPCFALVLRHAALAEPRFRSRSLASALFGAMLWANVHGSFVLAPIAMLVRAVSTLPAFRRWVGGEREPFAPAEAGRRFGIALAEAGCVALATCVNPRGPSVYLYALQLGGAVHVTGQSDVSEWQALSLTELPGLAFAGLAALGFGALLLRRRRAPSGVALFHALLALLSFKSQRFVAWWALSFVVAIAPALSERVPAPVRRGSALSGVLLTLVLLGIPLATLPGAPLFARATLEHHLPYAEARVLSREVPLRTVQRLRDGYVGRLFHEQAIGGFVEWVLAAREPRPVAFVDQRFELTPPALWSDYFAICAAQGDWRARLEHWGIGTVLVDERHAQGLVSALALDRQWRLVSREFHYRLYMRAGS